MLPSSWNAKTTVAWMVLRLSTCQVRHMLYWLWNCFISSSLSQSHHWQYSYSQCTCTCMRTWCSFPFETVHHTTAAVKLYTVILLYKMCTSTHTHCHTHHSKQPEAWRGDGVAQLAERKIRIESSNSVRSTRKIWESFSESKIVVLTRCRCAHPRVYMHA